MKPLAEMAALEQRLGRELVGEERVQAEATLADASALVRAYGDAWPARPGSPWRRRAERNSAVPTAT